MAMEQSLFTNFAVVIIIATVICAVMRLLRQPLIMGYIITGLISGPQLLGIIKDDVAFGIFSQFGIAFLLFLVGIGLDPLVLKGLGRSILVAGFGQILTTFVAGLVVTLALGYSFVPAAFLSIGLTFASTIIVVKLLSDKNELETLPGRISIGILLIQDLVALVIMLVIGSIENSSSLWSTVIQVLGTGALLIAVLAVISVWVLPRLMPKVASSQEFLTLFSIAWLLMISALFSTARFSLEMGALLAGVALSMSPYRFELSAKVKPLRDFFVLLFFVLLGSQMMIGSLSEHLVAIVVLSLFVLVGNPLIVLVIMCRIGYTSRAAFLAGLTMANVSEFSLVLFGIAINSQLIDKELLSLLTTVALITIAGSTYMVKYGEKIFHVALPFFKLFERLGNRTDECGHEKKCSSPDVVLFGYNRIGHDLLRALRQITKKVLVVDFNPDTIKMLSAKGVLCQYGDGGDRELLNDLNLDRTRLVCSTIPNEETNRLLIRHIRAVNKRAIILAVSHQIDEALRLYKDGATYVLMPHFLGGTYAAKLIERHGLVPHRFKKEKAGHIKHLKMRRLLGHDNPHPGNYR